MNTKTTIYVLLIGFFAQCASLGLIAQITNAGFESSSAYPSTTGQWQLLPGWNNAGSLIASPDYYHYFGSSQADIPETPMAIVDASEGQAIMGLIMCGVDHSNVREYINTELENPLEVGKQYIVSFKMSNGQRTEVSTAGLGTSDIGIYFSTVAPIQVGQNPISATPQFAIDTVFYSREWRCINFTFTAAEPFKFMTFGLFGSDDDKVIQIQEGSNPTYAYYFVDDFFLELVPEDYDPTHEDGGKEDESIPSDDPGIGEVPALLPDEFFVPNTFTPNGDGSNDYFLPVSSLVPHYNLEIFNRWGDRVYSSTNPVLGWDGSYNSQFAAGGAYVWEISYMKAQPSGASDSKSISGILNLVR